MISRTLSVLAVVVLWACGGDAPAGRARVLEKIPANVTSIAAADARALAHARFRPLVDALRSELPAGLDCVVDAALGGEHIAAGVGANGEITIALVTHGRPSCPALSQIEDNLWIATIGAGAPAASGASIMSAQEHARARPFLRDAPIAVYTQQRGKRVLATATPEPLAAWAAFEEKDVASAATFASELAIALKAGNDPVASSIVVERKGSQVIARLGATKADLAIALRAAIDRSRAPTAARAFPCPSPMGPPVLGCEQRPCTTPLECAVEHNKLEVYSLASATDEILAARKEAVIVNGRVEGIRFRDDLATLGLRNGDMLVSIDGKRVTSIEQVTPYLQTAQKRTQLIVARLSRYGTIELVEQ